MKKTILQICVGGNVGSTGKISEGLGLEIQKNGWTSYIAYARNLRESASNKIVIGNFFDLFSHGIMTRLFDRHGLGSKKATKSLINEIKAINPDLIHLHHLHGYYINYPLLFEYLKESQIPVVWTFHDFWSLTGHCCHFDHIGCEKWKTECNHCPQKKEYPKSIFRDRSRKNFLLKKKYFTSLSNIVIVNVSKWADSLYRDSFMKNIPSRVIYNGIDVELFKPRPFDKLDEIYDLKNKYVILGVAGVWHEKKGLFDFVKLSKNLKTDEIIVLVGLEKSNKLPKNIIQVPYLENMNELVIFYSRADVYLNLSYEETFGLTTVEALSCGTPAIVYNSTACPELVDTKTGFVVNKGNIDMLMLTINEIRKVGKENFSTSCRERVSNYFDHNNTYNEYLRLYQDSILSPKQCSVTTEVTPIRVNNGRVYQICMNCVMDTTDESIKFDENGMCDHCNSFIQDVKPHWQNDEIGKQKLEKLIGEIKLTGKGKDFDCILGLSGGIDSSYMLHKVVRDFNLRPLVFHVDGGWNSELAVHNINVMIEKLGLDLYTEVINWEEMKDFQLAFFKSGVPHIDIPQDHAFVSVLYKFAKKNKIKYIMNGGNISTECVQYPMMWLYYGTDMFQINDIVRNFCTIPLSTYPFSSIFNHKVYLRFLKGVKVIKPLNFLPYNKYEALVFLEKEYGWKPYPQKHFESRFTKFYEGYWLPERFGFDTRKVQFSSLILTGQMTREEAIEKLKYPAYNPETIEDEFNYIATKLGITSDELRYYMNLPKKYYWDYKNIVHVFNLGAKVLKLVGIENAIRR